MRHADTTSAASSVLCADKKNGVVRRESGSLVGVDLVSERRTGGGRGAAEV